MHHRAALLFALATLATLATLPGLAGCARSATVLSSPGTAYVITRRGPSSDVYFCNANTEGRPVCTTVSER